MFCDYLTAGLICRLHETRRREESASGETKQNVQSQCESLKKAPFKVKYEILKTKITETQSRQ